MNKQYFKDTIGWGFILWFIGYLLGIIFFMFVPPTLIGWVIMPIGTVITVWVLFKKIIDTAFGYYLSLAIAWTVIAVVFDYFFLVKLFKPLDGYYKFDVYLYYFLTFVLPLVIGGIKCNRNMPAKK